MSIFPLPVFEADADPSRRDALTDAEVYARLKPPSTIVVRVGRMGFVAEYPYDGDAKPGCGSKLVARTHRGTELVEMLTTTCGNSGCSKSVSRQEMLDYIERSGGSDYPFHTDGRILRVAAVDDLNRWSQVQARARERVASVKAIVAASGLPMKVVDVEPILGEELLTVYFLSEERVDFRELVRTLAAECGTRIELRQVGARDEARLVADYERCGQHCCCKNFLKVLKPVSMRSAKVQKATLDPLKISGRCGRLMCCLRYEDETYEDLKRRLPRNKTRVGTAEGPGIVVDSKILVQLVLVQLEHDGREIAVPVEELIDPADCPKPGESAPASDPMRGLAAKDVARRGERSRAAQQDAHRARAGGEETAADEESSTGRRRRRRRRRGGADAAAPDAAAAPGAPQADAPSTPAEPSDAESAAPESEPRRRRRRRRRRGGGGGAAPDVPAAE